MKKLVFPERLRIGTMARCKCGDEIVAGHDGKDPHCPNAKCRETLMAGTNVRCPEPGCGSSDLTYRSTTTLKCEKDHLVRLSTPCLGCYR